MNHTDDGSAVDTTARRIRRCPCHFVSKDAKQNDANGQLLLSGSEHGDALVRCHFCVRQLLASSIQKHRQALVDHASAKEKCEAEFAKTRNRIPELQAESKRLRDKSAALRKECGGMAVKVAQICLENEMIRERMTSTGDNESPLERQAVDLERFEQSLLEQSLEEAIHNATLHARFLRFQWARKVFAMHRLQIDPEDIKLTPLQKRRQESQPGQQLQRRARGIAKISGLPLPNAGPELYGVLPPRELQSALRIVATVTSTVARCLGIVLPHRILLTSSSLSIFSTGDITDTVSDEDLRECNMGPKKASQVPNARKFQPGASPYSNHPHQSSTFSVGGGYYGGMHPNTNPSQSQPPSSSTASIYSMMDRSYFYNKAKKALAKATGQQIASSSNKNQTRAMNPSGISNVYSKAIERSFDASIVAQRLNHATAAILTDVDTPTDNHSSSKFTLSTKEMQGDDFTIALQLLQNNVITLCIRAGVPISKLWPAEAMLLNLYELDKFCQAETSVDYQA